MPIEAYRVPVLQYRANSGFHDHNPDHTVVVEMASTSIDVEKPE
jgi:hypothetical protein